MSLADDMERGQKAARLLADPILIEARKQVAARIHEAWETAPLRDKEGAHELRLMLKALNDVWALLEQAIADGKLAAIEFEQLNRHN